MFSCVLASGVNCQHRVMDIVDYLEEAMMYATKVCTGEATALEKLMLRDLVRHMQQTCRP